VTVNKSVNRVTQMTNIGEEPVTITIGGAPGDGVTEYVIEPNQSVPFHENYCKPVPGAGHQEMPSILARQSSRDFPDGVRRPLLVPASEAKKEKERYAKELEAWKKKGSPAPKPSLIEPPAR
jgi:hypothetical protein